MTPYYSDDLVTIYLGDCREWMPRLSFDSILTDPPYGTGFDGVSGDDQFPHDLLSMGIRPCVAFGSARRHIAEMQEISIGWVMPERVMVWAPAISWTKAADKGVLYKWSPIYCWRIEATGRGEPAGDVFRDCEPAAASSITKPVTLMRRLLPLVSGTVLDPFLGRGSTLVAAKSLNRHAIGIEIEERYCEIAATRCSQEVLGLETREDDRRAAWLDDDREPVEPLDEASR